jgi:hypothetical protein
LLIVDVLVKDKDTIAKVQDGLRQISLGYNANYIQLAPGKGRQRNIIVNHVALVDQGRCGLRCAVQDEMTEEEKMDEAKIQEAEKRGMETGFLAAAKAFFTGNKQTKDEGGGDEVAALKKRIAELEALLAASKDKKSKDEESGKKDDEEEEEKKSADKKTKDAKAPTMDAATVSEILSTAGIIAPGYKPTTDALASPEALKRDILAKAYTADAQKAGAASVIETFTGKDPKFDTMDAAVLNAAFVGTGGIMKMGNNATFAAGLMSAQKLVSTNDAAKSFADKSKELWG